MFDRLQRARHLGFWHSVPCFSGRGDGDVCTIVCIDDDPSDTTGLERFYILGTVQKKAAPPERLPLPRAINRFEEHPQADLLRFDAL
nr:hypothetical protein [Agrobacterium tumefaciens]